MTAPVHGPKISRHRRLLIGLALMFFAPLGLSFYLYYGHGAGARQVASTPAIWSSHPGRCRR